VQPSNRHLPILIERIEYFTAADIQRDLGIARQTLWRWRKGGKIPQGRRYRDRQIVFTRQEVEAIREHSNRLEPADSTGSDQLKLFRSNSPKGIT
jgi:predicted DNA-binding transcriptional regulator AlpA